MGRSKLALAVATVASSVGFGVGARAATGPYLRPIALGGAQAPGTADGMVFALFFTPQHDLIINSSNQILTHLVLTDRNDTNHVEIAMFSGSSATSFVPVARAGQELVNQPGVFPKLFGQFALNGSGGIVSPADLQGPGTTTADNLGFLGGSVSTGLSILARKGGPVPGLDSTFVHKSFFFPSINDSGLISTGLILGGSGTNAANDTGIYVRRPGAGDFEVVIREGATTPDNPGQVFGQATLSRLNNNGQLLSVAGLSGAGISSANNQALYSGSSTASLVRLVQTGSPAPGLANGINLASFDTQNLTLNKAGAYAFRATLAGGTAGQVTTANDTALFVGSMANPGSLALVAAEGAPAPIAGAGNVNFSGTFGYGLTGNGTVVFTSDLTNRSFLNNSGIFAGTSPGDLRTIAVEGQAAPGSVAGATFYSDLTSQSAFSGVSVNSVGQVVFVATLKVPGLPVSPTQKGLYVYDPVQGIVPLAVTGGTVDVGGTARAITDIAIGRTANGEDGQGAAFNANGTVVFQASGSGFSGIFTANVPLVGDANLDGEVSFGDFQALERNFNLAGAARAQGDFNGDSVVDTADFRLLLANYGRTFDGTVAVGAAEAQALAAFASRVPEPTTALLLPLAGLMMTGRSRGRRRRARDGRLIKARP